MSQCFSFWALLNRHCSTFSIFIHLCLDSGPARSVCHGKRPQSVFSPGAVSTRPLAEDWDTVLQEPGLWLWAPSVYRTANSWGRDANLPHPCGTQQLKIFTMFCALFAHSADYMRALSCVFADAGEFQSGETASRGSAEYLWAHPLTRQAHNVDFEASR